MANVAISSNTAMTGIDFSHSVFFAQVVNRRAYGRNTWVLDTGATNHKMLAAICARINQKMSYMLSSFVRRLVVFGTLSNGSTNRFRLLLFVLVIFLPSFCIIMKNFKLRSSSLQLGWYGIGATLFILADLPFQCPASVVKLAAICRNFFKPSPRNQPHPEFLLCNDGALLIPIATRWILMIRCFVI